MNNLTNENIKPFAARRYRSTFSSVATTRNSDHCHKLWKLNWSEFVVVAAGENGERYIPAVKELYSFTGQIVHSSQYKFGHDFKVVMLMAKAMLFIYGDPFKYGIIRPKQGFFTTKLFTEEIIHVGTVQKIREDNIQDYEYVMKDDRFPKTQMPKYWKGEKNIYCAGFSRKGIAGAAQDVMSITEDIKSVLTTKY